MGRLLLHLLLSICFLSAPSYADDEATLGVELEFTNFNIRARSLALPIIGAFVTGLSIVKIPGLTLQCFMLTCGSRDVSRILANMQRDAEIERWRGALEKKAKKEGKFTVAGNVVTYPDGWWFGLGKDPTVIEVGHKKFTPTQFREGIKDRIRDDIYGTAASVGLRPAKWREGVASTGGHLNFGFHELFADNPLLLLNFIIDFSNHAEISTGVLVNDNYSAEALRHWKRKRDALKQLIQIFKDRPNLTAEKLTDLYGEMVLDWKLKNNALVFQEVQNKESGRMEIRSSPTFQSVDDLEKAVELFLARIEYLKQFDKPLELIDAAPEKDPFLQAKAFNEYLVQSGKRWQDYQTVMARKYARYRVGSDGELIAPNPVSRVIGCALSYLRIGMF
jgi:hypothetical protein